jgi:hypothetical protein
MFGALSVIQKSQLARGTKSSNYSSGGNDSRITKAQQYSQYVQNAHRFTTVKSITEAYFNYPSDVYTTYDTNYYDSLYNVQSAIFTPGSIIPNSNSPGQVVCTSNTPSILTCNGSTITYIRPGIANVTIQLQPFTTGKSFGNFGATNQISTNIHFLGLNPKLDISTDNPYQNALPGATFTPSTKTITLEQSITPFQLFPHSNSPAPIQFVSNNPQLLWNNENKNDFYPIDEGITGITLAQPQTGLYHDIATIIHVEITPNPGLNVFYHNYTLDNNSDLNSIIDNQDAINDFINQQNVVLSNQENTITFFSKGADNQIIIKYIAAPGNFVLTQF